MHVCLCVGPVCLLLSCCVGVSQFIWSLHQLALETISGCIDVCVSVMSVKSAWRPVLCIMLLHGGSNFSSQEFQRDSWVIIVEFCWMRHGVECTVHWTLSKLHASLWYDCESSTQSAYWLWVNLESQILTCILCMLTKLFVQLILWPVSEVACF